MHAATVLPPLWWQKGCTKGYTHGRFFRYPSSTKPCPSCSPLEDSKFATTNQNLSGTGAWINQTTTIKSITLGKKSIFQSELGFSRPGELTNVWSKSDFQITAEFWVGFFSGFGVFFILSSLKVKSSTKNPQVSWIPCLPSEGQDMREHHRLGKRLKISAWTFPPCYHSRKEVTAWVTSYTHHIQKIVALAFSSTEYTHKRDTQKH